MPSGLLDGLSDKEIAAVLTYVRNSFGNKAPMVTHEKVKQVRLATQGKVGFYSPEELLNPGARPAATGAPARKFVKMWAMDDFKGMFDNPLRGRTFERGVKMFEVAGCIKCHNIQGKGGNVGADLSKVGEQYPGAELLRQIILPSVKINGEHRVFAVFLKNQTRYKGMIARRERDTIHLAENLQKPEETMAIKKSEIVRMTPSEVSPMPTGLLVTLSQDEILDLVAYIASRGDKTHGAFSR